MEETRTGGTKEFIFSLIWLIILLLIGRTITNSLETYKIIGTIVTIIMFCVLGFFVLTRYCAIYTYLLKNDRLVVTRKIGHRIKQTDLALSSVISLTRKRPDIKTERAIAMRTTVFSPKNVYYLTYKDSVTVKLLIFEPSKNMADKIMSRAKKSGKSA